MAEIPKDAAASSEQKTTYNLAPWNPLTWIAFVLSLPLSIPAYLMAKETVNANGQAIYAYSYDFLHLSFEFKKH